MLFQATGNLGSFILSALLAKNQFNITAITRSSTTTPLPSHPSLRICRGSYDDLDFLSSSLAEQEVLIIVLAFMAPADLQTRLVDAAAKAGIKWILPTEFGSDNANPKMLDAVPMNAAKTPVREKIESLGSKWVGIATNPWFAFVRIFLSPISHGQHCRVLETWSCATYCSSRAARALTRYWANLSPLSCHFPYLRDIQ